MTSCHPLFTNGAGVISSLVLSHGVVGMHVELKSIPFYAMDLVTAQCTHIFLQGQIILCISVHIYNPSVANNFFQYNHNLIMVIAHSYSVNV